MSTQNNNAPDVKPALETLEISGVKFAEGISNVRGGRPSAKYIGRDKGACELVINADLLAQHPELSACERVRLFVADGAKPIVAIFPAEEGEGVRFVNNGSTAQRPRKVIKGTILRALSAYRSITYKLQAITAPRKGWQLLPVTSEKKGAV